MFSGEEMNKRLELIRDELGCTPDLTDLEELTLANLAALAGQLDAYTHTAYRMVVQLICDIKAEIKKDEEQAEANRIWWEKYNAENVGSQGEKEQGVTDAE